jgi:hypothetical protein
VVPGICTGDENRVVVFCPSRPSHHYPMPIRFRQSFLLMNETLSPPLIALHVVPGICTGDENYVTSFCPNIVHYYLVPHDHRVPSVLVANEC